jgi:hypothetical protein
MKGTMRWPKGAKSKSEIEDAVQHQRADVHFTVDVAAGGVRRGATNAGVQSPWGTAPPLWARTLSRSPGR